MKKMSVLITAIISRQVVLDINLLDSEKNHGHN